MFSNYNDSHRFKDKIFYVNNYNYNIYFYDIDKNFEIKNISINKSIKGKYSVYKGIIKLSGEDINEEIYLEKDTIYNFSYKEINSD